MIRFSRIKWGVRIFGGVFFVFTLLMVQGCVSTPLQVTPAFEIPETFTATGDEVIPDRWWEVFNEPGLDILMDRMLTDNFSLKAAWDRLDQTRERAIQSGAANWPTVDGSGGASRTRSESDSSMEPGSDGKSVTYRNDFSLGLTAGYEIDLWGRVRSARDAAVLDARASESDLSTAALTLTAELARTWFKLIEQRGQLDLLDSQMDANEKQLEVITLKFQRGLAPATDVLQQEQVMESLRGERALVEASARSLEYTLAIFQGEAPGEIQVSVPIILPKLPALPVTGIPLDLVRRRPDVRSAELRVQSADRRLAEAVASQFPRLSISTRLDTSGAEINDLFSNWLASLAGNLMAPILDGGRRRSEVRRNRSAVSEQLNLYNQTVLTALKDIETALVFENRQQVVLDSMYRQVDLSAKSLNQTLEKYVRGAMDFTRYIVTLKSHQQLQRQLFQAQLSLVSYRIDLYRALAGSWMPPKHINPETDGKI